MLIPSTTTLEKEQDVAEAGACDQGDESSSRRWAEPVRSGVGHSGELLVEDQRLPFPRSQEQEIEFTICSLPCSPFTGSLSIFTLGVYNLI